MRDPQCFLLVERHRGEPWLGLDRAEAALELGVGLAQRFLGVHLEEAGEVDDRKEEVPDFLLALLVIFGGGDFFKFFEDLGAGS